MSCDSQWTLVSCQGSGHSTLSRGLQCGIFFAISEDSKYAKCNKFLELVARGGGNSAKSYNTSNVVYHLSLKRICQLKDMKKQKEKERDAVIKE